MMTRNEMIAEAIAIVDEQGYGADTEESYVEFTNDTLENFRTGSNRTWHCSRVDSFRSDNGFQCLQFEGVQEYKGQTRYQVIVIDFGEIRASVKF